MAIASKQVIVIKPEQVVPAVTEEKIVLELSKDEAETLREILQYVGGDPTYSPRKHAESLLKALRDAGVGRIAKVDKDGLRTENVLEEGYNNLFFLNYSKFTKRDI